MTTVVIAPRVEDPTSDVEAVASNGFFQIRPSAPYVAGGQWVTDAWSDPISFTGSAINVFLDPLPSVPYEFHAEITGGTGSKTVINEFRIVAGAGPVGWETLTLVTGPGGGTVAVDTLTARVTTLEGQVGGISGGASNLASITDMSPLQRTANAQTTAAAIRTTLGAGTSSLALGTTSSTAKAGDYQPASTNISDATTIGKTILTSADAAAVRTAIGAGNSGLTIGTTTGTAADGGVVAALGTTVAGKADTATVNAIKSPMVVIYCPGDADQPRQNPDGSALTTGQHAWFIKKNIPTNMSVDDVWIPRDF